MGPAIWRNVPEMPDWGAVGHRLDYLGTELSHGNVGTVGGHLFLGQPFPDRANNPPKSFPAQDQIPKPLITPIPDPAKPEILSTPIPEPQKAGPVGGGFQPVKPDIKNEGLVIPKPPANMNVVHSKSKPDGVPAGTLPIDQAKKKFDLSKDDVHTIKDGLIAGPQDWVGIDPEGNVWTGDENNRGENHGPYRNFLH